MGMLLCLYLYMKENSVTLAAIIPKAIRYRVAVHLNGVLANRLTARKQAEVGGQLRQGFSLNHT